MLFERSQVMQIASDCRAHSDLVGTSFREPCPDHHSETGLWPSRFILPRKQKLLAC